MSSGSAMDALIDESLGALLRASADALQQSALRDRESAQNAMAARTKQAESAVQTACTDPRMMSPRAIQDIVKELASDASRIVGQLSEARVQQEQDVMAVLVKEAVNAVQATLSTVKDDLIDKQRKQTGDVVRKLKAAARRQQEATESAAAAEVAQEFQEKEASLRRQVQELTEEVESLSVRAESAEGVVERSFTAANDKTAALSRECEALRRQLAAVEERHRSERAIRLNLQKTAEHRGAEFWRKQPSNTQIKPNRSVAEMRREEEAQRERVRLAEAYTEKRRQEQLEEAEQRRRLEAEQAKLARQLQKAQEQKQREDEEAAAAAARAAEEARAKLANQRPPLVERQGNLESQQRLHCEHSDHEASAIRKEQRALDHDRKQQLARRPLSPTHVSPRRSDGTEGWDDLDRTDRPESPSRREVDRLRTPQTSPRRRPPLSAGHAPPSAMRQPNINSGGLDNSILPDSMQALGASQLGSPAYGSGVFERSVAELNYSASVAQIFGVQQASGYNPNSGAVSTLRPRPHSAAAGLPGGVTLDEKASTVCKSGLPLQVLQGQETPLSPPLPTSLSSISTSSIGISNSVYGTPQSKTFFDLHVAGRGSGGGGSVRGSHQELRAVDKRKFHGRRGSGGSGGAARHGTAGGRGSGKHSSIAVQRAEAMMRYHREVLPKR